MGIKKKIYKRKEDWVMKVTVDEETCIGCESCVEMCPEVFEMSDDKAIVKVDEVPEGVEESCREAAENCPVEAIQIEE
jgi:ferredoxin